MSIRRIVLGVAALAAATAAQLGAQLRADPGTVINGRVAVRVYVTLSDEETSYVPIGSVSLRFFRTTADTVVLVRTDEAGAATALLAPGEYRLLSTSPVDWKGSRYSWNQLVQVRAGIPTIELTSSSAERMAIATESPATTAPRLTKRDDFGEIDAVIVKKDPSAATMYSFFLPGWGQMYSGERLKGGGLLALSAVGVAVAAKQLSCASASDCGSTTGGMALGAAGMVAFFGSWLYGIMDAGDAARRFNMAHGLAASGVEPLVAPGPRGTTRLGFSVALSR